MVYHALYVDPTSDIVLDNKHMNFGNQVEEALLDYFNKKGTDDVSEENVAEVEGERDPLLENAKNQNFKFATRGALGARWQRHIDHTSKEEKHEYKEATRSQKEVMRANWLKRQYEQYIERRTFTKTRQKIELKHGTPLNIDALIKAEGGRKSIAAVQGAINYAKACLVMRGKWVSFNTMSKRIEFLYVKKEYRDLFSQAWSETQEEFNAVKNLGAEQAPKAVTFAASTTDAPTTPVTKAVTCAASVESTAVEPTTGASVEPIAVAPTTAASREPTTAAPTTKATKTF